MAQLGGGFVGEGDGEDFFGGCNAGIGEELEESLHQQAGFAGTGRGFDDAGRLYIQSAEASFRVGERSFGGRQLLANRSSG